MDITLKELLTTYWAQMVAVGTLIAFFVARTFDLRIKKIEHKQELFQQHRFTSIIEFMKAYDVLQTEYRTMLDDFGKPVVNVPALKSSTEKLYSSYFFLKLYLDPLELARYADLVTSMNSLLQDVSTSEPANVSKIISEALKSNNDNLKVIGRFFRENSSKHYPMKM